MLSTVSSVYSGPVRVIVGLLLGEFVAETAVNVLLVANV
jgi:hypothetical protein